MREGWQRGSGSFWARVESGGSHQVVDSIIDSRSDHLPLKHIVTKIIFTLRDTV